VRQKFVRALSILLIASFALSSTSSASVFDSLDQSSAFAGASLALANFFSANDDAAEQLTIVLEKVAEANQEVDKEDNYGKVTNEKIQYTESITGTVCTEGALNIRQDTTTLADTIGQAYEGTQIEVLGESILNGIIWYNVKFEGVEGYALGRYILFGDDVDNWYYELHERKKREAVMPDSFKITEDLSTVHANGQSLIQKHAGEVNYCLKVDYPKAKDEGNYLNQYSILIYILENLSTIQDYALAFDLPELYDRVASVVETINLVRENLVDTTGISDEEYDDQIQKAAEERLKDTASYQGAQIALYAATFVDWLPYVWGGASLTTGADCSGFCQQIYAHFGLFDQNEANAHAYDSWRLRTLGREVSRAEVMPGDLICYNGHVAIYYGDGIVVHEPRPGRNCSFGNIDMLPIIMIRRVVTGN